MPDSPNRRPPKPFEPPPWEQGRFEDLARLREEVRQESELDAALAALGSPKPSPETGGEEAPGLEQLTGRPADTPQETDEPAVQADESAPKLDEKVVAAMFLQLRHEEPAHDESLWKASLAFSMFSAVIGSVLLVWGFAALLKSSSTPAGLIGGSILLLFGGMFVGVGAWMAVRSLKERECSK